MPMRARVYSGDAAAAPAISVSLALVAMTRMWIGGAHGRALLAPMIADAHHLPAGSGQAQLRKQQCDYGEMRHCGFHTLGIVGTLFNAVRARKFLLCAANDSHRLNGLDRLP